MTDDTENLVLEHLLAIRAKSDFPRCIHTRIHTMSTESNRAIAQAWLTAGGLNDSETIRGWLDTVSPDTFSAECLAGWFSRDLESARPDPAELSAAFLELAENRAWLGL